MTRVRALFVVAAALTLGATVMLAPTASSPAEAAVASKPPNFIVITTDDQSMHSFKRSVMPNTYGLADHGGTKFTNGLAAPPLCCPSRAGFLTAQYPHNHGVLGNHPGYASLIDKRNTLPVWLDGAGYRTGFVGKYLNGTSDAIGARPAPGWDSWYAIYGDPSYYGATVSDQGVRRKLSDRDYLTTQFNRKALQFLKRGNDKSPFFLWLAQYAPHARKTKAGYCTGSLPEPLPSDLADFRQAKLPKAPSFNERNNSDKPPNVRRLDRLSSSDKHELTKVYRCTLASLQEVDRGVRQIVHHVKREGELDNTFIVFTSDNGVYFGEHRIPYGKALAYEETLRVPLVMRPGRKVLGGNPVQTIAVPAAQIDLAPTFLELAGARPCRQPSDCRRMDGRSLLGLLDGFDPNWPEDRGVLAEVGRLAASLGGRPAARSPVGSPCGFSAIRTMNAFFSLTGGSTGVGCRDAANEFYDLQDDPFELRNRVDKPEYAETVGLLRTRLESLRRCSGVAGRDPNLPDRPFCE